jgi:hypothetical protein
MRRTRWLVVALGCVVGACGAFGASTDSTDAPDAADGAAEGSADGASGDAGDAPADASSEASPRDGGSDASPCNGTTTHWVCDDFDQGPTLSNVWAPFVQDGGALSIQSPASAPSPPNVVLASEPGSTGAMFGHASIVNAISLRCDFDFAMQSLGTIETLLVQLEMARAGAHVRIELRGNGAGLTILEDANDGDGGATIVQSQELGLPVSPWGHASLRINLGAPPVVAADVAGTTATGLKTPPNLPDSATSITANFGVAAVGSGGLPWAIAYDNIVCDHGP